MTDCLALVLRPDGRYVVRPYRDWTRATALEAVEVAEHQATPVLAVVAEGAIADILLLVDTGFVVARREAVIAFEVEAALRVLVRAEAPAGIEVRSATDVGEAKLLLLDDELRQDVPGTAGWRSTPDEFREHTFGDPAFDPRTYLVAVDRDSGTPVGLVRVWMNPSGPRLGLVGVRRRFRRRRIATTLLAHAFRAVAAAGADEVTAEYDVTNCASHALAVRLGARRLDTTVELVYEPRGEASRVA